MRFIFGLGCALIAYGLLSGHPITAVLGAISASFAIGSLVGEYFPEVNGKPNRR